MPTSRSAWSVTLFEKMSPQRAFPGGHSSSDSITINNQLNLLVFLPYCAIVVPHFRRTINFGGIVMMKSFTRALVALGMSVLMIGFSGATLAVEPTPNSIPGGAMVDAAKVADLQAKGAIVVDSRVAAEYAEKHIKGAINIMYKEVFGKESKLSPDDKFDLAKLPSDKATSLIFYCNGSPCWKGYKAAAAAIKAGYKHVFWFRDGMPAWEAKNLPTE
jgi:rhodanese-related sulfurtransferase